MSAWIECACVIVPLRGSMWREKTSVCLLTYLSCMQDLRATSPYSHRLPFISSLNCSLAFSFLTSRCHWFPLTLCSHTLGMNSWSTRFGISGNLFLPWCRFYDMKNLHGRSWYMFTLIFSRLFPRLTTSFIVTNLVARLSPINMVLSMIRNRTFSHVNSHNRKSVLPLVLILRYG